MCYLIKIYLKSPSRIVLHIGTFLGLQVWSFNIELVRFTYVHIHRVPIFTIHLIKPLDRGLISLVVNATEAFD